MYNVNELDVKRLKLYQMDYECQEIFNREYSKDPFYISLELIFPSRGPSKGIQFSLALCDEKNKIPIASICCFSYISKHLTKVLRVTKPLLLPCSESLKQKVISSLFNEIYEIGTKIGVKFIEAELYREINSKIFSPSSESKVNAYNRPEWISIFKRKGFEKFKVVYCFELDLDKTLAHQLITSQDHGDISIRKCRNNSKRDREMYYQTWSLSDECPYNLAQSAMWGRPYHYCNIFGMPRIWYSDISYIFNFNDYILFAEKNQDVVGFIHWWPNLYPITNCGPGSLFPERSMVKRLLSKIKEGKIFKIVVKKEFKDDKEIERKLIFEALSIMKNKFKLKTCQIGNVNKEDEELCLFIQSIGGKKVHELWLMRKKLSHFF